MDETLMIEPPPRSIIAGASPMASMRSERTLTA